MVGMYIRRTTIKSRRSGEPYFTYRLVESVREAGRVRQRTVLNLGRHFDVPRAQWPALVQRIEALLGAQSDLFADALDARWEQKAQQYAAQVIHSRAGRGDGDTAPKQYHSIDVGSVDLVRPRSVAVEHVALSALRQVGLDEQLTVLGFNGPQRAAAIGSLIGRMTAPGSELATHWWLQQRSALGELIDFDFTALDLMALYRISDRLLAHKPALEAFLYERERDLFDLDEVITLYDLTNTYFEGTAHANANAAFGKSKEKRSDCPLVTLALVLDARGFPPILSSGAAKSSPATPQRRRRWPRWCGHWRPGHARRRRRWYSTPASPPRRTSPGSTNRATATSWSAGGAIGSSMPTTPA